MPSISGSDSRDRRPGRCQSGDRTLRWSVEGHVHGWQAIRYRLRARPGAIRGGMPGALGVIQKPVRDLEPVEAIQYVADR
ncbi:hypothetical protein ELI29_34375 (plasmid) [Rhizobium leguminosarum]|nr:hypothetical protein ELI29_34375 [Rhizobium leguminosarum]